MKKEWLPIHILIVILTLLALWSSALWNGTDSSQWLLTLRNLALLALGGLGVRFFIKTFISSGYSARRENRIITLLILFLLFDTTFPWWLFAVLGAVTEAGQYFFRTQLGPVFNPAALGALLVGLFGYLPSWWGVNPVPRVSIGDIEVSIASWLVFFVAGYVASRYRKLPIIWMGALAFFIAYFPTAGNTAGYLMLEGTLIFFLAVMACEPKTSPNNPKEQFTYALIIGFTLSIGLLFHLLEPFLIALLLGNIYTGRHFLINGLSNFFRKPLNPA